ncbi:MAG TPA: response regulator transcription factor [Planctomycetota bacterium]|nr:response regulator transcription factor [Planctomycetota bacterium]
MPKTVAVVDDEADVAALIRHALERDGYAVRVYADGGIAGAALERDPPDAVVLDLMLPVVDGLELCRRLRRNPKTAAVPIVMLTAKGEDVDVVAGLEVGADDYLAKPFSPRVLVARVRAVLRRAAQASEPNERSRIGPIVIDAGRHQVEVGGKVVALTATEFRLLRYLASRPGRVRTRGEIVDEALGDVDVLERTVDAHVTSLRRKLGDEGERIETVRGVGYRLREE